MEDFGRVVHAFLKGAVEVRECFCTAGEPKVLAQVVAALGAIRAVAAHDAGFDSNSLSD
jgi:hypothetical protein